eukprot:SAG31_NODE_5867_length_2282_cov_13.763628_2_plen_73_part_00
MYKLVGPVLVKQDLQEGRANIQKRMEFIKGEMCGAKRSLLYAAATFLPMKIISVEIFEQRPALPDPRKWNIL